MRFSGARIRQSLLVHYTTLAVLLGLWGCSAGLHNTRALSQQPEVKQVATVAEEKGCLSCHEGIEVINDNMQPFLLSFAKKLYGKNNEG